VIYKYSLRPGLTEPKTHFTRKKNVKTKEREKIVLSAFVKYWCILHYHKCKVEYIELEMMKVILIRVIKGKK